MPLAPQARGKRIQDAQVYGNSGEAAEEMEQFLPEKYHRKSELTILLEPATARKVTLDLEIPVATAK